MSHQINSMMYVGEAPWHKLGTKLEKPATAEQAIEASGLDYTVAKRPLKAIIHGHRYSDVPDNFATVRMDTGDVLGVVGNRYQPIQNRDAFAFFDALVGEGEAIYETAGALGKGERIWILAKLPGYIKVRGKDIVGKYLLLTNSHDGSSLVRAKLTPIRVVCNNTLSAALSGAEEEVRVRHTPNAADKLEEAHKLLGLTNELYQQLDYIFNRMALKKVTNKQLLDYVKSLIPDNEEAEKNTRTENIRNAILELHESGQGAELCRGTLWGAYNAVTEYTDHLMHGANPDKRLNSIWFGGGERLKLKAYQAAESLLN
jgi:phage/plasmid-like protein (TIGR03299 family)